MCENVCSYQNQLLKVVPLRKIKKKVTAKVHSITTQTRNSEENYKSNFMTTHLIR